MGYAKDYVWKEWKPNIPMLLISLGLYVLIIILVTPKVAFLTMLAWLCFGWSFAFGKKKGHYSGDDKNGNKV